VKPNTAEGVVVAVAVVDADETDTELDELPVGDDETEVESEVDPESGRAEPVGITREVTMVLAASLAEIPTEGVVAVPDASAAQPVADTVTVDTRVTVTMLSVPMTTVGVTIPFDAEEVVAAVGVLEVLNETELGSTDVEDVLAVTEVGTAVEVDEIDKS